MNIEGVCFVGKKISREYLRFSTESGLFSWAELLEQGATQVDLLEVIERVQRVHALHCIAENWEAPPLKGQQWEVFGVLGWKVDHGFEFYQLDWGEGWEPSWEPKSFMNCWESVVDFFNAVEEALKSFIAVKDEQEEDMDDQETVGFGEQDPIEPVDSKDENEEFTEIYDDMESADAESVSENSGTNGGDDEESYLPENSSDQGIESNGEEAGGAGEIVGENEEIGIATNGGDDEESYLPENSSEQGIESNGEEEAGGAGENLGENEEIGSGNHQLFSISFQSPFGHLFIQSPAPYYLSSPGYPSPPSNRSGLLDE